MTAASAQATEVAARIGVTNMSMDMNGTNALDGAAAMPGRGPARVQAGAGYGAAAYARQAAKQYRSTNVTTASPATLVLMMYDGALRFIRQGVEAIPRSATSRAPTAASAGGAGHRSRARRRGWT